ncbi:hypothetical protein FNL39_104113 [Nocardia caishijiensis]|uniref:Uncharacterized protein n=2 Tax=Nocardia caishijiensis TaxID=184756 RepID=A0ABQ6YLM6_9NOCA|nr:hypothetical protein [Nocardia caishijiensis]KAF0846692.1 hypothetical protein FNL39_104113 [Nocardia caishijiensis]
MNDSAVFVVDRLQLAGIVSAAHARALDIATAHGLRIVHTIVEPGTDLESLLEYIDTHGIAVAITPTYRHIQNNPTWVRTRCDLITTDPPSYQRRQRRLVLS